jgi:hypothetical protein
MFLSRLRLDWANCDVKPAIRVAFQNQRSHCTFGYQMPPGCCHDKDAFSFRYHRELGRLDNPADLGRST